MQERFCKVVGKVLKLWERLYRREIVGKVSKFQERLFNDNFKAEKWGGKERERKAFSPSQIYGRHILPKFRFTFMKNVNIHNSLFWDYATKK